MTHITSLDNIRIVLINTSHPGNIGSAARAMKTMGLKNLYLVEPKRYPASDANMMSAGAEDILEQAILVDSLDEALKDCQFVVGTSARDRSLPWPMQTPYQAAEKVIENALHRPVAILFGREDKGLKNNELQRCHYHIQIPANETYSSLNLASAVQVLCYEFRMRALGEVNLETGVEGVLADAVVVNSFIEHFEKTLYNIKFLVPGTPNRVMPRLRKIFNRSRLDHTEIDILRGILSSMNNRMNE